MTWTKVTPSRPGWYWWRWNTHSQAHCIKLGPSDRSDNDPLWYCSENNNVPSNAFYLKDKSQWAGPIPEPDEPG